LEIVKEY